MAVGVGDMLDDQVLQEVASDKQYYFKVEDPQLLDSYVDNVAKTVGTHPEKLNIFGHKI